MKVLLLFLDGVGIGPDDPDRNPFLRADLPTLRGLLGGIPTLAEPELQGAAGRSLALDATLGVEGTPRSGTGHTAVLTGRNAAELHGEHFGPWVPVKLRPLLERENVLVRAREAGREVAFANAYPPGFLETRRGRRSPGPPLAARAAGALTRHAEALAEGRAVASGIVNRGWREVLGHTEVPEVTPEEAGANLARIAAGHGLTLFAHYDTDRAGHRAGMEGCVAALERVDLFLTGLLPELPGDLLLVIASDHGNVEDVNGGHTRNPTLCVMAGAGVEAAHEAVGRSGAGAATFRAAAEPAITAVAPAVLEVLGAEGSEG